MNFGDATEVAWVAACFNEQLVRVRRVESDEPYR
jgi:hypothetical protein